MDSTFITVTTYLVAVILGLAVLENLLVILVFATTSQLRMKYFAFVFHLALADLLFALMKIAHFRIKTLALSALLQACFFVSVLTILAVAVNRYLALSISPPFRYDALVTRCRLVAVCLLIWCISLALPLPVIFLASDETRLVMTAWVRPLLVLAVWIVTAVLYLSVFRKIKSYTPPLSLSPGVSTAIDSEQTATRVRHTRRLLATFAIILATSFICWTPYNIGQIIAYFLETGQTTISKETFDTYEKFSIWMYCLSPAINPLIYWWRLDSFRQGFKALFGRCLNRYKQELGETIDEQNSETIGLNMCN